MLRVLPRLAAWSGLLAVFATVSPVHAQLFGRGCDCDHGPALSASMVSMSSVACQPVMQPVVQSCYQAVPVTEYQQVKQMVRRPKIESRVVQQDVIEYVPVTEQRTAEVPHITYQDVTECQQVARNGGYWQTHIQQNVRP